MDLDGRLIVYGVWAFGSLAVWGLVFIDSWHEYQTSRKRPERRSQSAGKELMSDFALLLVAVGSCISIVTLVVGQDIPGVRGFALAVALGGFLGAGIVKATAGRPR